MSCNRVAIFLCALVGAFGIVPAQAKPPATEAQVQALIDKLGSDDWAERQAAQARLTALAELAEPQLQRAARESNDAEVRARCDAALAQIVENRLIGPTLITLHGEDIGPRALFTKLSEDLDVPLEAKNPSLWQRDFPTVTIDADRQPFWDVIRQFREQCGLDLEASGGRLLIAPAQDKGQTVTHGPFRIRAARIARAATVDLIGGGLAVTEFTITVMVQAEPKLRIARAATVAKLELAEDEQGVSLLPGNDALPIPRRGASTAYTARPGVAWWPASARLEYPAAGAGKRVARLRGSASCTLLVRADTFEVPDVLGVENVVKDVGGTSITVKSCRRSGSQYVVVLSTPRDGPGMEVLRNLRNNAAEGARLVTSAGVELSPRSSRIDVTPQTIDVTLTYIAVGAPADAQVKLVWQVPTDIRNVDIPFEFTDLPLP